MLWSGVEVKVLRSGRWGCRVAGLVCCGVG